MTSNKKLYPYQNLSLTDLKGEKWKSFPGFEGYYEISSFGRVKSSRREIAGRWGTYMNKARVLKIKVDVKHNYIINQSIYSLLTTLCRDGNKYAFSIGRAVYCVFIQKFDMSDPTILITPKDNDGRNMHVSNLMLWNRSKIMKRSFAEGRHQAIGKPVTQFNTEGKPIASYENASQAYKETGISPRLISSAAHQKTHTANGYFWKYGYHKKPLNLDSIHTSHKQSQIHLSLAKRLGVSKKELITPAACINLSLQSMNGEKWKAIPGYESLYHISSMGRVKALKKVTQGKQQRWMPEKIKMLTVNFQKDVQGKEKPGSMLVMLSKDGVKETVSVARYVYYTFVENFDLEDTSLRVYYKDHNPLNSEYKNLILKESGWSFVKIKQGKK